jgi:hypothetical protein
MRSTRLLITIAAIGAVALPTAGAEAASRLSLRAANKAATKEANVVKKGYSDEDGLTVTSFDLSPCDRDGRRRAECDVTYTLSDGEECDDTITVRLGSRNRVKTVSDSEDAGDYVFDDCTDPADDSGADDPSIDDGSSDETTSGDFPGDGSSIGDVPGADDGSNL